MSEGPAKVARPRRGRPSSAEEGLRLAHAAEREGIASWLDYLGQRSLAREVRSGTYAMPAVVARVSAHQELQAIRARAAELTQILEVLAPDEPTGEASPQAGSIVVRELEP